MAASVAPRLKYKPTSYYLSRVNQHETPALLIAQECIATYRRQNKPSLVSLMLDINHAIEQGLKVTTSYLRDIAGHEYKLLTQRLVLLLQLGYISRERLHTKHPETHKNLRFTYFSYSLTDSGIRYLLDIFCKEDDSI